MIERDDLFGAIATDSWETVRTLLAESPDVSKKNSEGQTALDFAIANQSWSCIAEFMNARPKLKFNLIPRYIRNFLSAANLAENSHTLDFSSYTLIPAERNDLIKTLQNNTSITFLNLSNTGVGVVNKDLIATLEVHPRIAELNLTNVRLDLETFQCLIQAIAENNTITNLNLANALRSEQNYMDLLHELIHLNKPNLISLNVAGLYSDCLFKKRIIEDNLSVNTNLLEYKYDKLGISISPQLNINNYGSKGSYDDTVLVMLMLHGINESNALTILPAEILFYIFAHLKLTIPGTCVDLRKDDCIRENILFRTKYPEFTDFWLDKSFIIDTPLQTVLDYFFQQHSVGAELNKEQSKYLMQRIIFYDFSSVGTALVLQSIDTLILIMHNEKSLNKINISECEKKLKVLADIVHQGRDLDVEKLPELKANFLFTRKIFLGVVQPEENSACELEEKQSNCVLA